MGNPALLLMDEPVERVAPVIIRWLAKQVLQLKEMRITMLFSEQNLTLSETVADAVYIIGTGRMRWHGTFAELRADPDLTRRYLKIGA